ncbi:hypothetical protein [Devosia sp.]|uniref:hypothetical protein n=1 Tax=Devosia sp. TaxID=1871048 RepID=UPI003A8CB8C5
MALLLALLLLVPTLWSTGAYAVSRAGAAPTLSVHQIGHAAIPAELNRFVARVAADANGADATDGDAGLLPERFSLHRAGLALPCADILRAPSSLPTRPSRRQAPRAPPQSDPVI